MRVVYPVRQSSDWKPGRAALRPASSPRTAPPWDWMFDSGHTQLAIRSGTPGSIGSWGGSASVFTRGSAGEPRYRSRSKAIDARGTPSSEATAGSWLSRRRPCSTTSRPSSADSRSSNGTARSIACCSSSPTPGATDAPWPRHRPHFLRSAETRDGRCGPSRRVEIPAGARCWSSEQRAGERGRVALRGAHLRRRLRLTAPGDRAGGCRSRSGHRKSGSPRRQTEETTAGLDRRSSFDSSDARSL